ncbi:MAG: HINT domain-containing protein, partial [Coriobacteriia bacterium]|nr:HINT domain-containing protein [Coriobacteriia bacterium]
PEQGWTSAGRLSAGDELLLNCGEVISIYRVQLGKTTTAIAVYNFEVEGKHTYFVSSLNVLVHNKARKRDIQQIRDVANRHGIDRHRLGRAVENYKARRGMSKDATLSWSKLNEIARNFSGR